MSGAEVAGLVATSDARGELDLESRPAPPAAIGTRALGPIDRGPYPRKSRGAVAL